MAKRNRIEREVFIPAPQERVWTAITTADELALWFGDSAEIDLRPGGEARIGWSDYDNSFDAVVEAVEPPSRFSFRWASRSDTAIGDGPSTLVEFTLERSAAGTIVRLVESGFAAFPEDEYERAIGGNETGWDAELADLIAYVAAHEVV